MGEDNTSQINSCWYVGAVWSTGDMTDKFISEGYWENHSDENFADQVNQIQVGDKIAIKSSYTQKNNLPFNINGGIASAMAIKCIGTVTKNYNNGKRVDVEWNKDYKQKTWYLFTGRRRIWKVDRNPDDWMYGAFLDFTFNDVNQDYDKFLTNPYWSTKYKLNENSTDKKYIELIEKYKLFFKMNKKAAFDNEVYKWELLTNNKGKKDLDLVNAVRGSNNLIYPSDGATLKTLSEKVPNELIEIVNNLLDENKEIIKRLADFKNDMKALVQRNLNSTNYAEDERTASDYLTYSHPERYTFYTFEIYNSFCKYLEINSKKTGEIYPHYCELLRKLESFVSKDDELLEMIENESCNYFQSNLLLAQNIVYVMLKEGYINHVNGDKTMNRNEQMDKQIEQLKNVKNLIFTGAPGTGKTFYAEEIAQRMNAVYKIVQFHPSYDYTDFVEGLRPVEKNGTLGFERKDGVFKEFCALALKNLEDSAKSKEDQEKEATVIDLIDEFISDATDNSTPFKITTGNEFFVDSSDQKYIYVKIPSNDKRNELTLQKQVLIDLLSADEKIKTSGAIRDFYKRKWRTQEDSYYFALYEKLYEKKSDHAKADVKQIERKDFVFIIDEINRGEVSKIFGELFYAIDPGYRGNPQKAVQTQYQNLIHDGEIFKEGFYVPENVYIIGTMNDIDRSVESIDFAFRRRFTWTEITAESSLSILDKDEAWESYGTRPSDDEISKLKNRLINLNNAISEIEGLNSSYHIGGSYLLKYASYDKEEAFEKLWTNHLQGVLFEYLRGRPHIDKILEDLKNAYNNDTIDNKESEEDGDEFGD